MRINKIKKKLKNNEPVFGIMIKEARNSNISDILQFARKTEITSVVRIPRLDYAYVAKTLDMGAEGIWVPHLDTVEQAKDLVSFWKYQPEGSRGAEVPVFRHMVRQEFKAAAD